MNVVVCGGGIAGTYLVNLLARQPADVVASVTLVEPKTYFEATNGVVGTIHHPNYKREFLRVAIPGNKAWHKRVKHVRARLASVQEKSITLSNGAMLEFDVLCLAMGSKAAPSSIWRPQETTSTREQRFAEIEAHRQQIANAKSVLVLGGGVVGVEMISELAGRFPHVQFHLAVAEKEVLQPLSKLVRLTATRHLKSRRNVKLHVNLGKIETPSDGIWKLNSAKNEDAIQPDVVLRCFSTGVNTSCLPREWLDGGGLVKVNKHLQIETNPNIFALGDLSNISKDKSAKAALHQTNMVVANIVALAKKQPLPSSFYEGMQGIVLKLGPYRSLAHRNALFGWYGLNFKGAYLSDIVREMLLWKIIGTCTQQVHLLPPFPRYIEDGTQHQQIEAAAVGVGQ